MIIHASKIIKLCTSMVVSVHAFYLALKSDDPAAIRTLLGCQSKLQDNTMK